MLTAVAPAVALGVLVPVPRAEPTCLTPMIFRWAVSVRDGNAALPSEW